MNVSRYTKLWIGQTEPCRCLQLLSNETSDDGNLVVILGSTAASTFHWGQENLLTLTDFSFLTVSVTTERKDSVCSGPPLPVTQTCWHRRGIYNRCAKRSVINNVDNAQSSKALALITWLSVVITTIWHFIISAPLLWRPECGLERWELWLAGESPVLVGTDCFVSWPAVLAVPSHSNCKCKIVWCA